MVLVNGRVHYTVGNDVLEIRRISANLPFILASLAVLLMVGLVGFIDFSPRAGEETVARSIADATATTAGYDRAIKPYIYQFDVVSQEGGESRRKIPYIWNQVWESAGWTPIKLMVDKYGADPQYQEILDLIEPTNLYQKRTVYKYLAMAASGGGWLAHSDTFPLHPFGTVLDLPNKGRMTAYSGPCLMSGNATEWLRFGKRVALHARHYHLPNLWNEEMAVDQLQMDYLLVRDEVFEIPKIDEGSVHWSWAPQHCQMTKRARAAHFRLGEHENFSNLDDPSDMVIKWLSMWLQSCERSLYFVEKENQVQLEDRPVLVTGSFHAPENYVETRNTELAEEMELKDDAPLSPPTVEISEPANATTNEVVQIGSYHVATDYNVTRQNETRLLRNQAKV